VTDVDVLQTLLATENAAAYGYGVLGGHLASAERTVASQAEDAHLARRDAVARLVRDRGVSPTPAAPGYVVPGPVADRTAALTLAARLEDGAAAAYRYGLDPSGARLRRTGPGRRPNGCPDAGVPAGGRRRGGVPLRARGHAQRGHPPAGGRGAAGRGGAGRPLAPAARSNGAGHQALSR